MLGNSGALIDYRWVLWRLDGVKPEGVIYMGY
jgi:hypothetical protein